jgi:hypothetical protein
MKSLKMVLKITFTRGLTKTCVCNAVLCFEMSKLDLCTIWIKLDWA